MEARGPNDAGREKTRPKSEHQTLDEEESGQEPKADSIDSYYNADEDLELEDGEEAGTEGKEGTKSNRDALRARMTRKMAKLPVKEKDELESIFRNVMKSNTLIAVIKGESRRS